LRANGIGAPIMSSKLPTPCGAGTPLRAWTVAGCRDEVAWIAVRISMAVSSKDFASIGIRTSAARENSDNRLKGFYVAAGRHTGLRFVKEAVDATCHVKQDSPVFLTPQGK
jgi:hypothetical protein